MNKMSYEKLKKMLCDELEELATKNKFTAGDMEMVHKLTDTIKNIDKIAALEEGDYSSRYDSDSSYRGGDWEARGTYGRSPYDNDGGDYSGARRYGRGRHYVRGHYSYGDDESGHMDNYSRGDAKQHMMRRLEEMLPEARTENERKAIETCIDKLERA